MDEEAEIGETSGQYGRRKVVESDDKMGSSRPATSSRETMHEMGR